MRLPATALLALVLLAASAPPAEGQILAPAGRTLFNRGVLVRSVLQVDELSGGGAAPGVAERRWVQRNAVVWGALPDLSLTAVVPFVAVETRGLGTTTGTGDAALFARYDLWRENVPGGTTGVSGELGVRLPTGGAFGDGSTDPSATLIVSHIRDPHWLVADLQVETPGEGDDDLRAGTLWAADLAYLRRLLPRTGLGTPALYGVLELRAEHRDRAERDGRTLGASGGELVFLTPGVEWIIGRRWIVELAAPIPVHTNLHGPRPEPSAGLLVGFRRLF